MMQRRASSSGLPVVPVYSDIVPVQSDVPVQNDVIPVQNIVPVQSDVVTVQKDILVQSDVPVQYFYFIFCANCGNNFIFCCYRVRRCVFAVITT